MLPVILQKSLTLPDPKIRELTQLLQFRNSNSKINVFQIVFILLTHNMEFISKAGGPGTEKWFLAFPHNFFR